MVQKTTWKHFLIIGISALTFIFINGCDKGIVEENYTDTYVYINNSGKNLILKVFNTQGNTSDEFPINIGESKSIICKGNPGTAPFYSVDNNLIGDSVTIQFDDNKCLSFSRDISDGIVPDEGTGIFNVLNYDNYSTGFVNQKNYTLYYTITTDLYNSSINCN